MAIIVYALDCKEKTIEVFSDSISALKHKRFLENTGAEVVYIDIPNISVQDGKTMYEVKR